MFFPLRKNIICVQYTDTALIFLLPEMGSFLMGVYSHPSPEFFPFPSSAVATGLASMVQFSMLLCPRYCAATQLLGSIPPVFALAIFFKLGKISSSDRFLTHYYQSREKIFQENHTFLPIEKSCCVRTHGKAIL